MTMPVYPGPTAAVMAACLPQTRTLSTRLPGQHHTEPATALQGGRTHLTPPPSRASTLPSGNRYAAACLPLRRQSPHPLFWKRLHDCLPLTLLQSGRDPIAAFSNSRPFLDYREGGQRRSGSQARTCLRGAPHTTTCTLRRTWRSGHRCKTDAACLAACSVEDGNGKGAGFGRQRLRVLPAFDPKVLKAE